MLYNCGSPGTPHRFPAHAGHSAAGTLRLFSLPDFRRLWFIGFTLSFVRWLEMLALALSRTS
jgi:hypothetical protein